MKPKKKHFAKWWVWIIVTVVFLVIVQILFRIEAPCKWLDAVWEAGDLITLVGTLVLGYIAVLQRAFMWKRPISQAASENRRLTLSMTL